ncbi:MAG: hypothetical protein FWE03_07260 [Firmicutes bacterium]|nr:hypothetical protein [Bacillota bacterium]
MLFTPGITGNTMHLSRNLATARQYVDNIAFFAEPVRIEEILVAYLNGDPIAPRPFLNSVQRLRATQIRSAFFLRTGVEFDIVNRPAFGPRTYYWVNPDMERSLWFRNLQATETQITNLDFFTMLAFSCVSAAENYIKAEGYWAEFTPAVGEYLRRTGYKVFRDGTFVFLLSDNMYNDLRFVLDNHVAPSEACPGCGTWIGEPPPADDGDDD